MKKFLISLMLFCFLFSFQVVYAGSNEYVLRPGDELSVKIFGQEDLSTPDTGRTPFIVRPDGKVSFALIGDVDVTGKNISEFQEELVKRYSKYLRNPKIVVNIINYGGTRVYVLGEVSMPGIYELKKSHRVIDALGAARGFTEKSSKKHIYLIRKDAEEPIIVNINKYLREADQSQNYELNDGDCLYLTSNHKISIADDVKPLIIGSYLIHQIDN